MDEHFEISFDWDASKRFPSLSHDIVNLAKKYIHASKADNEDVDVNLISEEVIRELFDRSLKKDLSEIVNLAAYQQLVEFLTEQLNSSPTKNNYSLEFNIKEGAGSIERVRQYALSEAIARSVRFELFNSYDPFVRIETLDSLKENLKAFWTWIENSPTLSLNYYATYELKSLDGKEKEIIKDNSSPLYVSFPKKIESGRIEWCILPSTQNGLLLTIHANRFCTKIAKEFQAFSMIHINQFSWWSASDAALFLLSGFNVGLNLGKAIAFCARFVPEDYNRSGAYLNMTFADIRNVSAKSVKKLYEDAKRETLVQINSQSRGRPISKTFEYLARLELKLLIKWAEERFAKGESVQPNHWFVRPKLIDFLKEMDTQPLDFSLSKNVREKLKVAFITKYQKAVPRSIFEPAFTHLKNDSDIKEAQTATQNLLAELRYELSQEH